MLKEVQLHLPFTASYGQIKPAWTKVADGFNTAVGECVIDHRRAQEKFEKLIATWKSDKRESLRASGTEEEYSEQEVLLTELAEQFEDAQANNEIEVAKNKKKVSDYL